MSCLEFALNEWKRQNLNEEVPAYPNIRKNWELYAVKAKACLIVASIGQDCWTRITYE